MAEIVFSKRGHFRIKHFHFQERRIQDHSQIDDGVLWDMQSPLVDLTLHLDRSIICTTTPTSVRHSEINNIHDCRI